MPYLCFQYDSAITPEIDLEFQKEFLKWFDETIGLDREVTVDEEYEFFTVTFFEPEKSDVDKIEEWCENKQNQIFMQERKDGLY